MTVVVGVRHRTGVALAADSLVTYNSGAIRELREVKTAKFCETVAIAGCGSGRTKQVIEYGLENLSPPPIGEDEHKWATNVFVDAAREALRDAGALYVDDDTGLEGMDDSAFMLAVRGRLFIMEDNFEVLETLFPWATSGSGGEVASGYFHGNGFSEPGAITEDEAIAAAIEACRVSIKLNAYVDGRITTETTTRLTDTERAAIKGLLKP